MTPTDLRRNLVRDGLTPEEAVRRLKFVELQNALQDFDRSSLPYISAEEVISLVKDVVILATLFFNEEIVTSSTVNPEVIVGETNVSNDKTVTGTVDSRKKSKKAFTGYFPRTKDFFSSLFGTLDVAQKTFKSPTTSSFEQIAEDSGYLLEAARSRVLDLDRLISFKIENGFEPERTRKSSSIGRKQSNNLFALLRVSSKQRKKNAKKSKGIDRRR